MDWVLLIGLIWLAAGILVSVPVGRTIRAANHIDEELARLATRQLAERGATRTRQRPRPRANGRLSLIPHAVLDEHPRRRPGDAPRG